ncbi:MAG TPA: hypothetical protein VH370_09330 [Humisphaera sp.]|jgi:hypothetical protein|nr:hypothetical protein [Humisphaera sp.]
MSVSRIVPWTTTIMLMLGGSPLAAQVATTSPTASRSPFVEVIKLDLRHPAATTQPALKYKLLPDVTEQTPGNAALLYLIATKLAPDAKTTEDLDRKIYPLLDLPIDQFPIADAKNILGQVAERLQYIELAARRQDVEWDVGLRERGANAWLPHLNDMRRLGGMLTLQAHTDMAQHDWAAANHTMQTGFAMARQLGSQPVLVQGLIETGIGEQLLARDIEVWIEQPAAPNLYWALSNLPQPFVELRPVAQWERADLYFTSPELAQALRGELLPDRWPAVLQQVVSLDAALKGPTTQPANIDVAAGARRLTDSMFFAAKRYLADQGVPQIELDSMTAEQVVGTCIFRQYNSVVEELWKAWELPFWQGSQQIAAAEEELTRLRHGGIENPLLRTVPAVWRARYSIARLDQHIAALRVVEALRDYAARHDGQPPQVLEEIVNLPIPHDPMSGKPFSYRLDGAVAILEASAPAMSPTHITMRFELTFAGEPRNQTGSAVALQTAPSHLTASSYSQYERLCERVAMMGLDGLPPDRNWNDSSPPARLNVSDPNFMNFKDWR